MINGIELLSLFFISVIVLFISRKVAKAVNLVDLPNARKQHQGPVPIVGGIAITICYLFFLSRHTSLMPATSVHILGVTTLAVIGALDDKKGLGIKLRLAVQTLIALLMILGANIKLEYFGFLVGDISINFPSWSYPVTILAVITAINAFNMIDGLDGLLGSLSIIIFSSLAVLLLYHGQTNLAYVCLSLITIISAYLLLNMGLLGKRFRIFMGDAGSMVIGWTVLWFLLQSTQQPLQVIKPVTALWIIALPLMDMVATIVRRIRKKQSPFQADRTHIHHILLKLGLSKTSTLLVLAGISALFSSIGIICDIKNIPDSTMFYTFLTLFGLYNVSVNTLISRINKKAVLLSNV
ncbi:Undecaprenyl-phosphate alpha-N-acetylglucosaminyl 1-phosphate transferase [Vibrio aerogenes CECT 7868]|uniref:Undecaprenyl-phosphate alpha-N-acetylglucosaminyl 1-phosphate transferase n=1 Tax=Vibrio aerogenes CECT 7868 TaxID=1216006 RepID=A0A1M5ZCA7_9VIBR|nr:UDP-N-acetylglucosamine--undecaprenyl-phosphate N-acetylglucosaminephosphotransferase [Vibrio aerogenes]SHI21834.1 Undecaprenyl-phosphate alpha-N-acetylglucosaminyl 1-phosphate transferase [Vibrio aerogenes CECT 7868]